MSDKPRTLLYRDALGAVERRIVDALPEIVDALITRARAGDMKAAVYLCDRILGRVAASAVPPADDCKPPYSEDSFALDRAQAEDDRRLRSLFSGIGARNGA